MGVDVNLVELRHELRGLQSLHDIIENEIQTLMRREALQTVLNLTSKGISEGDPEYKAILDSVFDLVGRRVPRHHRGAFLVALWSIFESGIEDLGWYLAARKGVRLRLHDVAGHSLRNRLTKYFRTLLACDLDINVQQWKQIWEIYDIRNALAHGNGRVAVLRQHLRQRIERLADQGRGVRLEDGFILLSREYIAHSRQLITEVLTRVLDQVAQ